MHWESMQQCSPGADRMANWSSAYFDNSKSYSLPYTENWNHMEPVYQCKMVFHMEPIYQYQMAHNMEPVYQCQKVLHMEPIQQY